jgi:hypothetical protein
VFTARYALSPYIKQIRFVFKGLIVSIQDSEYIEVRLMSDFSDCDSDNQGCADGVGVTVGVEVGVGVVESEHLCTNSQPW